ncbi:hypothetical protein Z956_01240 [Clostridium botulinum D str. CCUG 7971]|uniref:NEAT domain-containing protein n=1 Tax=Clostridium botulinum TaxID=1491 RepID=UPI00052DB1EA|nr:NEAT domain-containing protein [Clostridium botulinum]KGM97620.1 hypothetical protein Z956_01240 [Clostridium botulinum D str. CCUG 7971]KOC51022.1 hypothetical protein ADU88_00930 [Clostridium botulinum]OOV51246.1 hypothetical protein B1A66_10235 [Clostridium botulinum D/C]OOV57384.1 hypothetical protein B0673_04410 [Clostridium botulinum D/C]OOV58441.1 hypothetical protein B1A68_07050 [Clostridium botulinum D/C]
MDIIKNLNKGVGAAATAIIIIGGTPQVVHAVTTNDKLPTIEAKAISKDIEKTIKQQNPLEKIKIKAVKLNNNEPSMAGTYIGNEIKYTKKDGKTYCEFKILASDWMNNIKVQVDNNEVKYELEDIGDTEVLGVKHKGTIIKFQVPKVNPSIKLNMFVVPMKSEVGFRIVEADNNKQSEKISSKKEGNEIKTKETENREVKSNAKEKVFDKLEDGVYTLTFRAYKIENPSEDSMLNNFFDKKIKLEVKNGKKMVTLLNTCFADGLYDFRIESNKVFKESEVSNYGEKNPDTEKYHYKAFKMEIDNLDSDHKGCVLAGPMGGKLSDYGNVSYEKANNYKPVMFTFNKDYKKGWDGFDVDKRILNENSNGNLNKALVEIGIDTNKDGVVSSEELKEAKGVINLSSKKIVDISNLKNLGSNVTELDLTVNRIEDLPKGVFDNLNQLTCLKLTVNKLKTLPEGIFDKLLNLKKIDLERNKLENLPKGIFNKLTKLETLILSTNNIKHLDDDIFINNKNLKFLNISENKIDKIPTSIGELERLNTLSAKNNSISVIPNEVSKLKNLTWLDLASNYIQKVPQSVYDNLKNLKNLELTDNMLIEVPNNILEIFPKVKSFDFRLNNLSQIPDVPKGILKAIYKYPQKTPTELTLKVKDGEITWSENLSSLDIMAWQRTIHTILGEKMAENIDEYKKHLNNKKPLELLIKEGYEPREIIKIQKKNKNGQFETIFENIKEMTLSENIDSIKSFKDSQMKAGDEYRILKELRATFYGDDKYIFTNVANAKVEEDNKDTIKPSNKRHSRHRNKNHKRETIEDNIVKSSEDVKDDKDNKKDNNSDSKNINIKENDNNNDQNNNKKDNNPKDSSDNKKDIEYKINNIDNNANEKQNSKNKTNVEYKNDKTKELKQENKDPKIGKEEQNQDKVSGIQKTVTTQNVKNTFENKKETAIKERKLPQTGMPFGRELFALIGSTISGLGVILMRKNKGK